MIQSKQVSGPASRSIVNYRLTCGFSASVFNPSVPKEDKELPYPAFRRCEVGQNPAGIASVNAAAESVHGKMHWI
jgi:hypothetical protein